MSYLHDFFSKFSGLTPPTSYSLPDHVAAAGDALAALIAGGGGVTDHGLLTGLGDDDHLQYHTDIRGDTRYYTKGEVDTIVGELAPASALTGKADLADIPSVFRSRLTADQNLALNSNALQNITNWAVPGTTNQEFDVTGILEYDGDLAGAGGPDFRIGFNGPAGLTFHITMDSLATGAAGIGGGRNIETIDTLNTPSTGVGALGIGNRATLFFSGWVKFGGTAGNFVVMAAQNVSTNSQTKVRAGSLLTAVEVL